MEVREIERKQALTWFVPIAYIYNRKPLNDYIFTIKISYYNEP